MLLSLSYPHLCISPKTPASLSPPFLSPPTPNAALRSINPKPPRSSLRSSQSTPTANKTLANSAIQRISEKLRSLGYLEENPNKPADRPQTGPGSAGEIFIPTPQELPKHRVGYTIDSSWSTPEHPIPEPGANIARFHALWRRGEGEKARSKSAAPVPMVAELTIPAGELRRLRTVGIRLEKRLKVGKAGITEGIVNGIHERWRRSELVKIKCEDLCRMNMKRTHETLERKTGGLVVWRSGSIIILYRGASYIYPYIYEEDQRNENFDKISSDSEPGMDDGTACEESKIAGNLSESLKASSRSSLVIGVGSPKRVRLQLPGEVQLDEEVDRLLDGLGPRFSDWWGCDPLPIDADLLPAIVPGFRKPFRLLPFGVMPKLTDREMTILRRLGRPLPCHFALGRNRNLQGLAVSMVKLWEKCEIAKIAVKRGVQNTNSEMMAEELKRLTGGTLLSRDKEFIVFYRGKDFLPPAVSIAIQERRKSEMGKQEQSMAKNSSIASTSDLEPRFAIPASANEQEAIEEKSSLTKVNLVKRQTSENLAVERTESRLSQAIEKKEKAEMLLAELEKSVKPAIMESDREGISEEERYMLRKVGLRMKPFLLLGRRGVFDGTVENMHLHWKYRELVKIISNDRSIQHVYDAARTLETESGGILVAVERVSKGHAIIVYRGKNYRRPSQLRPKTLLNKKAAMKRSLEAQRRESLKLHVLSLTRKIDQLQRQRVIDNSPTDSVQLVQHDASYTTIETKKSDSSTEFSNISAEFVHQHGNVKEVDEADAEFVHSNENVLSSDTGETANVTTNDKLMASKHDFSKTEAVQFFSEPRNNTSISNYDVASIADVSMLHPEICLERDQVSCSATNYISNVSDEESIDLSLKPTQCKPETCVHDKLGGEHKDELPFKASPLSNRERLILRKQALKMRKRPVLAVGRSNVLTGVAKTIKTHFRKYPLAIVNIKGRANGTSVHELIFELEQATGAVLVSREPNKVILYRGWGEGEVPGGAKGKDAVKSLSGAQERPVSPQLIAAIRRECGLEASQVE